MVVANSPKRIFARRAALRVQPLLRLRVELLEQRWLLTINWVGTAGGGDGQNWSDPLNWSGGALPGPQDDVTITLVAGTINHAAGNDSIKSLHSSDPLNLSGGSLTVSGIVEVDNTFTMSGGTLAGADVLPGSGGQGITAASISSGTLDGVTLNANLDLTQKNGSVFADRIEVLNNLTLNGTVFIGAADGSAAGSLQFDNGLSAVSQILSGNGTILFGSGTSGGNEIDNEIQNPGTLTIGSGILIHGNQGALLSGIFVNQGTISADMPGGFISAKGIDNQGTMSATAGATLHLFGTWSNSGAIAVTGGTLDTGQDASAWSNSGTITATNSTLNLNGTFATTGLGQVIRSGSTVNLTGTLENTGAVLSLDPTAGSWNLEGGTIKGGTVNVTGGANLIATALGGTLDGVTINGNVDLRQNDARLTILDNLVLNGTAFIGSDDGSTVGNIQFGDGKSAASQSLSGSATILFGANDLNTVASNLVNPGVLMIAAGVTLRGKGFSLGGGPIVNLGTIATDSAGGQLTLGSVRFDGLAQLLGDPSASIFFFADLLGNTQNATLFHPQGRVFLNAHGTAKSPQLMEVMSADLGAVAAGFTNNFDFGSLSVGGDQANPTYVKLVDNDRNSSSPGPEALYVDSLAVPAGSTLDLNNLHVYAHTAQIDGTVINGSVALTPVISIGNVQKFEGTSGTTAFVFTVSLSQPSDQPVTVAFATSDGTARVSDKDYVATSGTLTFKPGVTNQLVTVEVIADTVNEADETFDVNLSSPTGGTLAKTIGVGTILVDDFNLAINDVSASAGSSAVLTVTGTIRQRVTVTYATSDGTATAAENDYVPQTGTLTFSPGDPQNITIPINPGTVAEPSESFNVTLSNLSSGTLSKSTGVVTILGLPSATISNVTVPLANGGITPVVFSATVFNPNNAPLTLRYATQDGTAHAADGVYEPTSGVLTFGPGTTSQPVTVLVNGALAAEPSETFAVNLFNSANALAAQGTGTIDSSFQALFAALASARPPGGSGSSSPPSSALVSAINGSGSQPAAAYALLPVPIAALGGSGGGGKAGNASTAGDSAVDARPGAVDAVMATFLESNHRGVGAKIIDKLLASLSDADEPHLLGVDLGDEVVRKSVAAAKPISAAPQDAPPAAAPLRSEAPQTARPDSYPWWLPAALLPVLLAPWIWTYRRRVFSGLSGLRHRVGL
jgi:hypothetical protein